MKTYITLNTGWIVAKGGIVKVYRTNGSFRFFIVVGKNGIGHILENIGWLARHKIFLANRVKRAYRAAKGFLYDLRWKWRR